jgi:hypothetical protein
MPAIPASIPIVKRTFSLSSWHDLGEEEIKRLSDEAED